MEADLSFRSAPRKLHHTTGLMRRSLRHVGFPWTGLDFLYTENKCRRPTKDTPSELQHMTAVFQSETERVAIVRCWR